jgi:predicted nucleotidyltransferase
MDAQQLQDYIDLLNGRYGSISSVWLIGSRARHTERPESDWDLLAFADHDSFTAMRRDGDLRAPGIDLLIVIDGDRFDQPWIDEGYSIAKFGYLSEWRWTQISRTDAKYIDSRRQEMAPAVKLWPRE